GRRPERPPVAVPAPLRACSSVHRQRRGGQLVDRTGGDREFVEPGSVAEGLAQDGDEGQGGATGAGGLHQAGELVPDGGDAVGAGVDVDADGGVGADGQRRAEARIGLAGHVSPSVDLRALSSSRWTDAGESRTWRATARTGSEPGGAVATMSAMA